ncbi:hypothetical protein AYO22_01464 [Fonsecaea multimorphosa]|nr:hypothetical protein AYO22_01464 [Fonsecaea multimorphosa]
MFAGPIAKGSLKVTRTVQRTRLEVLPTVKGDGYEANLLEMNVLWNNTIRSLDQANFSRNHMLEYLPPYSSSWIYEPSQWDPTWTLACNSTEETLLHNISAVGNYTFLSPIEAFPGYRRTYDPTWLNASKYRTQVDFASWSTTEPAFIFEEALFFILIQSDPVADDRMYTNNATMDICFSVLHLSHFNATSVADPTLDAEDTWLFVGPVHNASYTRIECTITRKPVVPDEEKIPWIWTNDTFSITNGYRTYFANILESAASQKLPVLTPTPLDILRMWQTYFVTVNTIYASPVPRLVSISIDTVQLFTGLLLPLVILTALTIWTSGRYWIFMLRNKAKLDKLGIPDSKFEWIIQGAKVLWTSQEEVEEEHTEKDEVALPSPCSVTQGDRDYLHSATFGYRCSKVPKPTADPPLLLIPEPSLARIHVPRSSRSTTPAASVSRAISRDSARLGERARTQSP